MDMQFISDLANTSQGNRMTDVKIDTGGGDSGGGGGGGEECLVGNASPVTTKKSLEEKKIT